MEIFMERSEIIGIRSSETKKAEACYASAFLFAIIRVGYLAGKAGDAGACCTGLPPCIGPEVGAWGICLCSVVAGTFLTTELPFEVTSARDKDVSIKTMAAPVVNLLKNVAAPLAPKSVWLEPPKAAPSSAPFPPCIRTIEIRNKQTIRWMISIKVAINSPF